jgi:hypothetical protein
VTKRLAASTAALLLTLAGAALAGPGDYVHSPIVEYGEHEIDVHGGHARSADGTYESALSAGWGIGLTPWWFTEAYVKFEGATGEKLEAEAIEWENIFQFTETGRYPVDVGMLVEVERSKDHAEGYEVVYGPLVQGDVGEVQLNGNLLLESHVHAAEKTDTELKYEWQAKLRWRREFEPGLQGFGELGEWNHWAPTSGQSHVWGPAVLGRLKVAGRQALRYDAALLFGMTGASADRTLRFRVEYEY